MARLARGHPAGAYKLIRPLNLTLHKAGQVTISASTAFTVTGAKNGQGTTTVSAASAFTVAGAKAAQGTATITASAALSGSGAKAASGTVQIGATGTITVSGSAGAADFDVIIGRPFVIVIGPPREVIP